MFDHQDASSDGVTRDIYETFFTSVYSKMHGSSEYVPQAIVDEVDPVIIGAAITHIFIMCSVFPFEIIKSPLKYCTFGGDISKSELYTSLGAIIMPKEAVAIQRFQRRTLNDDEDAIKDILTEYLVFAKPTYDNVDSFLENTTKVPLIKISLFSLQSLVNWMGNFWKKIDVALFDALCTIIIPSSEKVIANLNCHETSNSDAKIATCYITIYEISIKHI